ncbi:glycosyltransferase family 2 protein [Hydrotalea sp.]|uniref:glycosyltransferase family 2 protein n=1 Tax=Hydrotalea sp. TaxID=2881279 RepID=UPI003D0EDC82
MFFSVIIPTCNRNDLLARCLACLQPEVQTLQGVEYEIIVTDDSVGVGAATMIAEQFPWVQWVAGPRRGPAANRNNGARLAKGAWLVFLDDDCEPDSGLLSGYYRTLLNHENIEAMEGAILCNEQLSSPLFVSPINVSGDLFWSCNIAIKKKIFLSMDGFDEQFPSPHMEDIDLYERLKGLGMNIPFANEAIVMHPPRRLQPPKKLAAAQESHLYYNQKHQLPIITCRELLINTTYHRLIPVRDRRKNWDSVIALKEWMQQIFYTWYFYQFRWKRKYGKN